jgi:DNA-binding SARP family transcriptional activator
MKPDEAAISSPIWIGILGPLIVLRDGRETPLQPGMRAVLAVLTLGEGRPVSHGRLADVLWGEQAPPASSAAIIQCYVSRLRKILGQVPGQPEVRRIQRTIAGYRLKLSPDELDVASFRRLVTAARKAGTEADAARATGNAGQYGAVLDLYEQALVLNRGLPLAELEGLSGDAALAVLADEVLGVILEFADAASAAGNFRRVLPLLRQQAALCPMDEAVQMRLMTALAGVQRQAEALKVYETLRERLERELGALPGSAIREVHCRLLRQQTRAQSASAQGRTERWTLLRNQPNHA